MAQSLPRMAEQGTVCIYYPYIPSKQLAVSSSWALSFSIIFDRADDTLLNLYEPTACSPEMADRFQKVLAEAVSLQHKVIIEA
jgi:hypothetical protein